MGNPRLLDERRIRSPLILPKEVQMSSPEQALATQLRNIEAKTGQDLAAHRAAIAASGKA